ncbi:MAG: hypothetical protein HY808_12795 [Nitrospirae bacterium]|nr:hypothetical protein [Nitrospirota bacterium]
MDMRSKKKQSIGQRAKGKDNFLRRVFFLTLYALCTLHFALCSDSHADVLDRIVAIVNKEVVLQSEYQKALNTARKSDVNISEARVLDEMINRILLLEQAKRLRPGNSSNKAADDDALVKEYIEKRIKSSIHVPIEEIEAFYTNNTERFSGKEFLEVKDEIEDILVVGKLRLKLLEHIKELRDNAYIRVRLSAGPDLP